MSHAELVETVHTLSDRQFWIMLMVGLYLPVTIACMAGWDTWSARRERRWRLDHEA